MEGQIEVNRFEVLRWQPHFGLIGRHAASLINHADAATAVADDDDGDVIVLCSVTQEQPGLLTRLSL